MRRSLRPVSLCVASRTLLGAPSLEEGDEGLQRRDGGERQPKLVRNGAAHPLDEPHEEERRAHVAERALGEAELVARVVRPASSTGRRTLETTAAGSISLWTREGRGAEGARKGEYATMERGTVAGAPDHLQLLPEGVRLLGRAQRVEGDP